MRSTSSRRRRIAAALAPFALFGTLHAGELTTYRLELLPKPEGTSAGPFAEQSAGGLVVVDYDGAPHLHRPDGTLVPLAPVGGVEGVSDRGFAVGGSVFGPPLVWLRNGQVIELPVPAGFGGGFATGVTDEALAAGRVRNAEGEFRPVYWPGDGAAFEIPGLGGQGDAWAVGQNGHAVGSTVDADAATFGSVGFYFDGQESMFVEFGLGGTSLDAVNDVGQAAGAASSTVPAFPGFVGRQAFLYDHVTGETTGLGFLGEWGYHTSPSGLNNRGDVVGAAFRQPPGELPSTAGFLWRGSEMFDLNELVEDLPSGADVVNALDVDDEGVILAQVRLTPGSQERTLGKLLPLD